MGTKDRHHLPGVGLRTFKTALAAALCALLYFFFEPEPRLCLHPAPFSAWAATTAPASLHGGNPPSFGTLVGGFIGHGAVRGLCRASFPRRRQPLGS